MTDQDPKGGQRVLHLTLKRQWFDMIDSGEKREEYREIKPYWIKRLEGREYDVIRFRNGYASDAPTMLFKWAGLRRGVGNPAWGADDQERFVISLGERITP